MELECDCGSSIKDEDGRVAHYSDCAIIIDMLEGTE